MKPDTKIYLAGHGGMVGSAIRRRLEAAGYLNIVTRGSAELDLRDQAATRRFLGDERPEVVFLAAARVGGILANNTYPADFIYDNLAIETNLIEAAWRSGVQRLIFLGSSCIYPKAAPQPMTEACLLSGPLEPTNEAYAVAKIAGIKMCQAFNRQHGTRFVSLMPSNLYGPNDNFDLETSHVLPAMLRKFHEAKASGGPVELWGSGQVRREFLHVDDLASACLLAAESDDFPDLVNIGSGNEVTIAELAGMIGSTVGYSGEVRWDETKPDGTARKLMDSSLASGLGWQPAIDLETGLRMTYEWFSGKIISGELRV